LVSPIRDDRANRTPPVHGTRRNWWPREDVDALDQARITGTRQAALVNFGERVGPDEGRRAARDLAELEVNQRERDPMARPAEDSGRLKQRAALDFTILAVLMVGPR